MIDRVILAAAIPCLMLIAAAQTALAQPVNSARSAVRAACAADIRALCAGVAPGGGRIVQCMQQKHDQLSDGCKTALETARTQPRQ